MAVTVEIANRHGARTGACTVVDGGLESAVAFPKADRDVLGALVRHGEIELPVPVEVANRHGDGKKACGVEVVDEGGLEGAVAVAKEHSHRHVTLPSHGQI